MKKPKYRHIIWDWNGTLLDDAWLCVDIMNGVLARRDLPLLTHERYQDVFDFPVVEYYRRMGFDFERESFEVSGTEFIIEYEKRRNEVRLQPHAKSTLEAVRKLGISQSLLSAYKQETLDDLAERLGVCHFFIRVIGVDNDYAYGKIENGKQWMEEMRRDSHHDPFNADDVLLVGDTLHDHEVAQAIGVQCALIPSGHHTRDRLETSGVPVLKSLKDVVALVT